MTEEPEAGPRAFLKPPTQGDRRGKLLVRGVMDSVLRRLPVLGKRPCHCPQSSQLASDLWYRQKLKPYPEQGLPIILTLVTSPHSRGKGIKVPEKFTSEEGPGTRPAPREPGALLDKVQDAGLSLNFRYTMNIYWADCVFICYIWQVPPGSSLFRPRRASC